MKVISLLGLPGSGKSFYGKRLAQHLDLPYLPEIATQLIYTKGFVPGLHGSLQFDQQIYERNVQTATKVLQSSQKVIWEGGPIQDRFFLEARIKFTDNKQERIHLLVQYETDIFHQLHKNTFWILFDVHPTVSLQRQRQRMKPELLTANSAFLHYIRHKLLNFCNTSECQKRSYIVNVNQSKSQILHELFSHFSKTG